MLHLSAPTDAGWFERVKHHLPTLLLDHTHLEKRAGSTAMSMIFRYADQATLAKALGEVVQEEMDHFVRMVNVLEERNITLERLEPSGYAASLAKNTRKKDPEALLDKLIVAALIEARSCERFQILAENLKDDEPELAELYAELYKDEARHHTLYTRLAYQIFDRDEVSTRLKELADLEVKALQDAGTKPPRLHSF